jgi:hypothetical protein
MARPSAIIFQKNLSALGPSGDIEATHLDVRLTPCVDGSELARAFFTSQG